jgi:microcompartment protein CcmK/EutM
MLIARVEGSAVATLKHELLKTRKLLVVRRADAQGDAHGDPFLALDLVGAGEGELVVVTQGSSARSATGHNASPVDAAIVGILDSLQVGGKTVFKKG